MTKGVPTDTLLPLQWHLGTGSWSINVQEAWEDYTGEGVIVGVMDRGFDYLHSDLSPNYRTDLDYDFYGGDSDAYIGPGDNHGTAVMGIIGADDNGTGAVGVAFDSDITGYRLNFSTASQTVIANIFNYAEDRVDILNNSWSYTADFSDNFNNSGWSGIANALINFVQNGRDGLGGLNVFAAGNGRDTGGSANYHNIQNSPYVITVGATDEDGTTATVNTSFGPVDFSEPGANVLISAPGTFIQTTDNRGTAGYASGDFTSFDGTSASTPIISGVIALMLEANPELGYRDVMEILALSARKNDLADSGWQDNGAGLHFNHDFGFGLVDATAAVRMAETWTLQQTYTNKTTLTQTAFPALTLPAVGTVTTSINITQDIEIEHVLVDVSMGHTYMGDITLTLISPDGTESTLMDRVGNGFWDPNTLLFEFSSVAHWGEMSAGLWTLRYEDTVSGDGGVLTEWSLKIIGNAERVDDLYVYTDERVPTSVNDTDGGSDTLNFAAVNSDIIIDLGSTTGNTINGAAFNHNNTIENVITGDGNDTLTAAAGDNTLRTGRGDDALNFALADNTGDTDSFDGDKGFDVLNLFFTASEWMQSLWDDLNNFAGFLLGNVDVNENDGTSYTFTTFNLTVSDVEQMDVYLDTVLQTGPFGSPPVNTDPIAQDDNFVTEEDTSLSANVMTDNGNGADSDPDTDPLNVVAVSGLVTAQGGSVDIAANGDFTYTPATGFFGTDSFTYILQDGQGGEDAATVTVTVNELMDPPTPSEFLSFEISDFSSYRGSEDEVKNQILSNNGETIEFAGNTWRKALFDYTITENTVLEFDFTSPVEGEVHAIGFDTDSTLGNGDIMFQVHGTQGSALWNRDFNDYTGAGASQHFLIEVGDYFTGDIDYLTFANDHDLDAKDGVGIFSNIKLYEETSPYERFAETDFSQYSQYQDAVFGQTVSADGTEVTLNGNTWRKFDMDYQVTADTVIEFDFKSTKLGEIHSFALESDDYFTSGEVHFTLYGVTHPLWNNDFKTYDGSGEYRHYAIRVGDFWTGDLNHIALINDHDLGAMDADSSYANFRLYEKTDHSRVLLSDGLFSSYSTGQDTSQTQTVDTDADSVLLNTNTWRKMNFKYTVTEDTVLEFDFTSTQEGRIQGIGLDNDNFFNNGEAIFQLFGTIDTPFMNQSQNNLYGGGTQHYTINLGDYLTGDINYLTFINDDDLNAGSNSFFENIKLYEAPLSGENIMNTVTSEETVAAAKLSEENILTELVSISTPVSFTDTPPMDYAVYQNDATGMETIVDDFGLQLDGNTWQKILLDYNVTENTVVEFDFSSDVKGEIHAIGFDTDNTFGNGETLFKLYGTQNDIRFNRDFDDYTATDGVKHYTINLGDYLTGQIEYLTFVNDDDFHAGANGLFSNITIYEDVPPPSALVFSDSDFSSYDIYQDMDMNQTVSPDGLVVSLNDNTWRKVNFSYSVTEDTVLMFDFSSSQEGEFHGIGFDTDNIFGNGETLFKLYGIQNDGRIENALDYYSSDGATETFVVPVGQFFTGDVNYLTFMNDDDFGSGAQSTFSNIKIFDDPDFFGGGVPELSEAPSIPFNALDISDVIDTGDQDILITNNEITDTSGGNGIIVNGNQQPIIQSQEIAQDDMLYGGGEVLF